MDDTELIEGLVFTQKASRKAGGPSRIADARIALLQFCISPPKTDVSRIFLLYSLIVSPDLTGIVAGAPGRRARLHGHGQDSTGREKVHCQHMQEDPFVRRQRAAHSEVNFARCCDGSVPALSSKNEDYGRDGAFRVYWPDQYQL